MGNILPTGDGPIKAPTRFRLWKSGNNPGDYGDNVVTPKAVDRVLAAYNKRGQALAIDIQHATNPKANPKLDPNKPPVMGGYCELRAINTATGKELWVDPVRWSDCGRMNAAAGEVCCGKHQIETGQRGYVSPDWFLDPDTSEPLSINRLSLVAEAGTYGINMLAGRASQEKPVMNDTEILKALLAASMGAAGSMDPDIQALGQALAPQVSELATAKGFDLSDEATPASEAAGADVAKPEEKMVAAAEVEQMVEKAVAKAVAAALPKAPASATAAVAGKRSASLDDVSRLVAESDEKRALIEANKGKLGALVPLIAGKSLAEIKGFVAACASRDAAGDKGAEVRGDVVGAVEQGEKVSLADRYKNKAAAK